MSKRLTKQPGSGRLYDIDLSPVLRAGDTVSSITSITAVPSGLTITGETHDSDKLAQCRIAGGTSDATYIITVVFDTTLGDTGVETEVELFVYDYGNQGLPAPAPPTTTTLVGGILSYSAEYMAVDTEGAAASDNLDSIYDSTGVSTAGLVDGQKAILRAFHTDRTVVITDGVGNVRTVYSAGTISLSEVYWAFPFRWDAGLGLWLQV